MKKADETVKTTVRLPRDLWIRVRKRALDEGRDAQDIVITALTAYLKAPQEGQQ